MFKKMNLGINFTAFTKMNSKRITNLIVKHKDIKLLEDNNKENLVNLGFGNEFLDTTPEI